MSDIRRLIDTAFTDIHRRLPGRFDQLRCLLETHGNMAAAYEFQRLVRAYDDELAHAERKVLQPWRR